MALFITNFFQGEMVNIRFGIFLLLPTFFIDALMEIPLAIEEPHPHQRKPQGGSGFEMVPGENAQTSCKNRKGFMNAEFHRKVGNGAFAIVCLFIYILKRRPYPGVKKRFYTGLMVQKSRIR